MAQGGSGSGVNAYRLFVGITAVVAALILVITQLVGGEDGREEAAVQLEPVSFAGPNPFTGSVSQAPETPIAQPLSVDPASPGATLSADGSTAGLYGGSLNQSSCDREQLVSFLEQDRAKARAWVDALNTDPTLSWSGGNRVGVRQIRDYVFELTPVILRADTWVTNHGYVGGRATPLQSVLQAGTAVLVDAYGVPRVKCFCGNPLLPPRRVPPVYQGTPWTGFDPDRVIIVIPPPTIIIIFVIGDVDTGDPIQRPPGTDGGQDTPGPPTDGGTPEPTLTVPPDVILGTGDVQVTLLWASGDDLDLHVFDPEGFELYFGSSQSPSGGQLDHDDTGGCGSPATTRAENVFWPEGGAPTGEYRAFVRSFSGCDGPASFELRITVGGTVVHQESGTLSGGTDSETVTFTGGS